MPVHTVRTETAAVTPTATLTPQQLGVGARFSVAVMDSDYVRILLGALELADASGLEVSTDDVSTFVGGAESDVLRFLNQVIAGAAGSGVHVTANVLLSRGCPGEVTCELPPGVAVLPATEVAPLPRARILAAAHWSVYPLSDAPTADGAVPDHMRDIEAAVDLARSLGTYAGSTHYATRLVGDLADVLATIAGGWLLVGRTVGHVTTHATLSLNSPTAGAAKAVTR